MGLFSFLSPLTPLAAAEELRDLATSSGISEQEEYVARALTFGFPFLDRRWKCTDSKLCGLTFELRGYQKRAGRKFKSDAL